MCGPSRQRPFRLPSDWRAAPGTAQHSQRRSHHRGLRWRSDFCGPSGNHPLGEGSRRSAVLLVLEGATVGGPCPPPSAPPSRDPRGLRVPPGPGTLHQGASLPPASPVSSWLPREPQALGALSSPSPLLSPGHRPRALACPGHPRGPAPPHRGPWLQLQPRRAADLWPLQYPRPPTPAWPSPTP